jgi:predicted NAD/FAD-binding protein
VRRLTEPFKERMLLGRGVRSVVRDASGVSVEDANGEQRRYDQVVFACHADQALAMIVDAHPDESAILSAFKYQRNRAVLHSDTSFMPARRKAWASWVYLAESRQQNNAAVSLTYWMNNLQPLATSQTLLMTLNPGREPDPNLVYDDYVFEHPVFDVAAIRNQQLIDGIQGRDRLWFCGAYQRYGFHEDGLGSAVRLYERMGISVPW